MRIVSTDESHGGLLPCDFDKLRWPELRHPKSGCLQHFPRLRSRDSDGAPLVADVRYRYVVHDDVLVEDGEDLPYLRLIGVDEQRLSPIVGVQITQNMSLRVEQKSVHAAPRLEITDIVGDHAVQPAHAVAAGKGNFGAYAALVDSGAGNKCLEFSAYITAVGPWLDGAGVRHRRVHTVMLCCHAHFLLI